MKRVHFMRRLVGREFRYERRVVSTQEVVEQIDSVTPRNYRDIRGMGESLVTVRMDHMYRDRDLFHEAHDGTLTAVIQPGGGRIYCDVFTPIEGGDS